MVDGHGKDSLEDLGWALRQLRRRDARASGQPEQSYRQLAAKTGWSASVIGDYFSGKTLPPADRFDVLIQLLGATHAEQRQLATARDRIAERRKELAVSTAADVVPVVPRQLPADIRGFTGRTELLGVLTGLLAGDGTAPAIVALTGPAGVGQTALAVHWGQLTASRFPDGQLYADLGNADERSAVPPPEVLRRFLTALGVRRHHVPDDAEERAALYRTMVAGNKILVVLDDVRCACQIRPLLPSSPGSVAVVTSRGNLSDLAAADAAHLVSIGTLTAEEARELLTRRLGDGRSAAEPEAVEEIIESCARLPLALTIAAARAAAVPRLSLHVLANELRECLRQFLTEA